MKIDLSIFMSCKAGFLLTISLFGQQEVIGFVFLSENQELELYQYFLKKNIIWQSQVVGGFSLSSPQEVMVKGLLLY